ncbi:hypothetical protein FC756_17070 [Lysinibacillus mangiferihumi]|uniref:Uncharacterized protein n=1 Tax=Lysinibacillus mangiferihumi TaxID=1130819 RepID=A0A4U2YUT6_9BACI|nr:hypothetical protein [Lysinibacillus mangiferihumi]TKI65298.1 hypothetical protein FC756_17070 [Lysinibacillus mangiferihumi]
MSDKKRLTLTGNKMPDHVYAKLEKLGIERTLTPYICNLVEKEQQMDSLISTLSILTSKLDTVEKIVIDINQKLNNTTIQTVLESKENLVNPVDDIREGKLEISNRIEGGIEEEIEERDF